MEKYPRVRSVQALPATRLRVTFENGEVKLYECAPLSDEPAFRPLSVRSHPFEACPRIDMATP